MASGIITLTRSGYGEMFGQIVWSSTSNGTAANTSTVTATIQVSRTSPYVTTGTWTGNIKVGGTTKTFSVYHDVTSSWLTLQTVTTTVSHNADGTGSCYIYGTIQGPGGTSMEYTSTTGSETVTLDKIPRQATLTSAANFNDEENPKITYTNPLGAAVPSLQVGISLDSTSDCDVAYRDVDKTAGTDTIDLTEAERDVLRAAVTGGNTRTVWIYLRTRIDQTYYYSPLSKTLTIKNPNPTISPTIKDTNSTTTALTGDSSKLVRYYSNAAITMGAAAVKKATLTSKKVTCGSKSLTADGTINAVESNSFVFTATDSRGNTTTKTVTPSFVDYIKLTCSIGNNMPSTDGSMTVKVTGNYFNGSFGAKSNSLNVYYRYKTVGGSYGSWTAMTTSKSGNTYSATANLSGLDYQTSYVFQTYAVDALATVYSAEKTVKATPVFDWSENDFNFNVPVNVGGHLTASGFELSEQEIMVDGDLNTYYPVHVYSAFDLAIPQFLFLKKNLNSTAPSWSGNHSTYNSSSIAMGWMYRANGWDGNGTYLMPLYKHEPYATLIAEVYPLTGANKGLVLWLRGGGASYRLSSNIPITATVYLSSTNIGSSSSPIDVSPMTVIGDGGMHYSNIPLHPGAAPSGYGLGEYAGMSVTTDCNTATSNGWYYVRGAANAADSSDHAMLVVGYGNTALTQIAFMGNSYSSNTYIIIRKKTASSWGAWEYVNPPMVVGVEYRTIERNFSGAPVYKKRISLGTLPNATTKTVSLGISGVTGVLQVRAMTSTGTLIPYRSGDSIGTITANKTSIVVYYNYNASSATAEAEIWYTK